MKAMSRAPRSSFSTGHWLGRVPLVGVAVVMIVASLSGNASARPVGGNESEGVYAHKIVVGGIDTQLGSFVNFSRVADGVKAYFDTVNAAGGVYGRKLDLAYTLNDSVSPATDAEDARTLVEADHVFAVVGVETPSFAGASYLREHEIPTFGVNIDTNAPWANSPVMFGAYGTYEQYGYPDPFWSYLPQQLGDRVVAVLGYNIVQSQQGCEGAINSYKKFGVRIGFEDLSLPIPLTGMGAVVQRMKAAGVSFVVSCMDLSGDVIMSNSLHQAGMTNVNQLWMSGYDPSVIKQVGAAMNGIYTIVSNVPFDAPSDFVGSYPGMSDYLSAMRRYFPGVEPGENSLAGWINADTFVSGLRAAGPSPTRSRLVATINRMHAYTAGGIIAPVDWGIAHSQNTPGDCQVFLRVVHGNFSLVFGGKQTVWTCFAWPYPAVHPPASVLRVRATTNGIGINNQILPAGVKERGRAP